MADFLRMRILGRMMVSCCMIVGGCRVWFLIRTPYCTSDRRRFGLRKIGMLHALSSCCVSLLRLHASPPRTYDWLFSLMSASCLGLRLPVAMTDGWCPPVQAVFSAGLCNAFLELNNHDFRFGARWRRLVWACVCLPSLKRAQPSAAAPEARWNPCLASCFLADFFVWHVVLPFHATDGAKAALMNPPK